MIGITMEYFATALRKGNILSGEPRLDDGGRILDRRMA
jgi:hypothetical protein